MTMLDVRFSDWIQKGFSLFINNAAVLLLSGIVAVVISAATMGLLAGPMLAGMAVIILNLQDERLSPPTVNDIFKGFDYFMATIPVTLSLYALFLFQVVFNFIPYLGQLINSVVVSVGMASAVLSVFHLVARRVPPRTSARTWIDLFKANWGPLLGFYILAMIIGLVGIMAFFVGLVVTIPVYLCIMGVAYLAIVKQTVEL